MAAQGSAPRDDTEEWIIEMLRMRRASPHGKWIETTRRKPVRAEKGGQLPSGHRLPRCAKIRKCVSTLFRSQAGLRTRQFRALFLCRPGPLAFPSADKRTVASGATRTDLPLRGQCRDCRGLMAPRAPASRFTRRTWNGAPDTCELDYSHTDGSAAGLADLL